MNSVFYVSALVAILSTVLVITRLNVVHALLYLIVSFFSVALIFFALGAPFVAALEIIIYAGAIMVLFVFVIMMLNLGPRSREQERLLAGAQNVDRAISACRCPLFGIDILNSLYRRSGHFPFGRNYTQASRYSSFRPLCYRC